MATGPGACLTEVFRHLKSLFKVPDANDRRCKCNWLADIMDRHGPAWCQENRERLVVVITQSARRLVGDVPFLKATVRLAFRKAMSNYARMANESQLATMDETRQS